MATGGATPFGTGLAGRDLGATDFGGADFAGTGFGGADFVGTAFGGTGLEEADPDGTESEEAPARCPGTGPGAADEAAAAVAGTGTAITTDSDGGAASGIAETMAATAVRAHPVNRSATSRRVTTPRSGMRMMVPTPHGRRLHR